MENIYIKKKKTSHFTHCLFKLLSLLLLLLPNSKTDLWMNGFYYVFFRFIATGFESCGTFKFKRLLCVLFVNSVTYWLPPKIITSGGCPFACLPELWLQPASSWQSGQFLDECGLAYHTTCLRFVLGLQQCPDINHSCNKVLQDRYFLGVA